MAEPQIRYVRSEDGTSIAYSTVGQGRPVVFAGSPSNVLTLDSDWRIPRVRRAIEQLAERRMVVRTDARGRGLSERDMTDRSFDAHVADLRRVVESLSAAPVDLVADSAGAVLIAFAARDPDRVRKMVISPSLQQIGGRSRLSPLRRKLGEVAAINFDFYKQALALLNYGWIEGRIAAERMQDLSLEELSSGYEAARSWDASADLPYVQCPVLVVHRRGSDEAPLAELRRLASSLTKGELRVLETSGMAMFDEEGLFVRAVIEFLDRDDRQNDGAKLPSGTAIILFADIVDSTALTERMGDAAFRAKARDLDTSLRAIITDAGGTTIDAKTLGDGVLATFPAASQAIDAALRCGAAGDAQGLPLHLGLHAGDVIREQNNVFGGAVNIAARISALAVPGEVLVSDIVRGLARTSAGVTFEDRGEHALKGVADAQRVFAVRRDE